MHRFITRLTCLLLLSIGVSQAVADTMGEQWMIEEASGAVSIKSATGERLGTQAGTQLIAPFTIVTGTDGRVVVSHRLDRITVGANSQSTIALPRHTEAGLFTVIKQKLGSALYEVEHRVKDSFEVDTPYLVSVVKGTTFNIHVTQKASSVSLVEGRLLVYTPDKKSKAILIPGQAAIKSIHSKGIILKDQQSLSEPVQGRITVVKDGAASTSLTPAGNPDSKGVAARLRGLEKTPLTDIGNPADMARVPLDIGADTKLDGSLSLGASAGGVPAGANVGDTGVTSLGGGVTTGGAGVNIDGGSVTNVNTGGSGISVGATAPGVSTSINSGSGTVGIGIGTGAGTAASTGVGNAVGNVTNTVSSPLP